MSEKEPLNGIDDSVKQIVDIMKPKSKKPDKVVIAVWIFIGIMALYMLYVTYQSVGKMYFLNKQN